MSLVRFRVGSIEMLADLNETECALGLLKALPIRSHARVWGQEVYDGTVAYWPPGKALCLFFGQTPASPVSVIGTMRGNPRDLAAVHPGDEVTVEAVGEPTASGGQGA